MTRKYDEQENKNKVFKKFDFFTFERKYKEVYMHLIQLVDVATELTVKFLSQSTCEFKKKI